MSNEAHLSFGRSTKCYVPVYDANLSRNEGSDLYG